jgi:hypothetical protein
LLVLALGLGVLVASAGQARPKQQKASPFAQQIKALHQINQTLHQADHDYKGHRVAAMKHIHHAVVALRGTAGAKKAGQGGKGGGKAAQAGKGGGKAGKGGGLPQAESDALLQQALKQVNALQSQLASVNHPRATAAAAALKTAAHELQTALKVK